jgi:hypothetical protein
MPYLVINLSLLNPLAYQQTVTNYVNWCYQRYGNTNCIERQCRIYLLLSQLLAMVIEILQKAGRYYEVSFMVNSVKSCSNTSY